MNIINNVNDTIFTLNGIRYFKNFAPLVRGGKIALVCVYDSKLALIDFSGVDKFTVDGLTFSDLPALVQTLIPIVYVRQVSGGGIGGGIDANHITFDTTPTAVPETQGTLSWSEDDKALQVVLNGYKQVIGGDTFYPVTNQSGSSIAKGTAVRFAGTLGASGRLLIAPFIANGSVQSSFFMGVTSETIADGAEGKVLWFGRIRGINTSAFSAGDVLYASTTAAGAFQTAVPQAPNNIVQVAAVINSHAQQGVIFVRPTIGSNINKDEGVSITNPQNGEVLVYNSTNGLFENSVNFNDATFTVELIDLLTVDFYAPADLKINSTTVISGSGTITIQVNDAAYTLGDVIQQGDKITVSTTTASVVNLNSRYE